MVRAYSIPHRLEIKGFINDYKKSLRKLTVLTMR